MKKPERIALFDLDGTLADYDTAMRRDMKLLASPGEGEYIIEKAGQPLPSYIKARKRLIQRQDDWWYKLNEFPLGFDVLKIARDVGFKISICTKSPAEVPEAAGQKLKWCRDRFGKTPVNISDDKGLIRGNVLVDDWPDYIKRWLDCFPEGLVIMPAQLWNQDTKHNRLIRYDGQNKKEVEDALIKVHTTGIWVNAECENVLGNVATGPIKCRLSKDHSDHFHKCGIYSWNG